MMPTTPFEDSGGTVGTTLEDEATFLAAVQAEAGNRMAYGPIGTTGDGRDYVLVRLGNPAPALENVTPGRCMLILGSVHGDEVSGREAALTLIRDIADSTDPDVVAYLTTHTLLVIPTANPDGTFANRRNARHSDLNRDSVVMVSPESRAISAIVEQARPTFVVDLHEMQYDPETRPKVELLGPQNPNTDPELMAFATSLVTNELFPLFADTTVALYRAASGHEQWRTNLEGLRGGIGILCEVLRQEPGPLRIERHRRVTDFLIGYQADNSDALVALCAGARQRAAAAGAALSPINLPPLVDPAPMAYRLTAAQRTDLDRNFVGFNIQDESAGDGTGDVLVSLAQPSRNIIPYLMDPDAPRKRVAAVRGTAPAPEPEPIPPLVGLPLSYKYGTGGRSVVPVAVKVNHEGATVTVWP